MTHPVTAGLDGSPESLAAADWAAGEAARRGLPLRLVHVRPPAPPVHPDDSPAAYWENKLLRETSASLGERCPGLEISYGHIDARDPVHALLEECEAAELLVLGSRGLSGMAGFLVGSVAMATAARAAKPVVLVRAGRGADTGPDGDRPEGAGPGPSAGREVVLGWDVRHASGPLVAFAFEAAALRGVPLRVVHAWKPAPGFRYDPGTASGVLEPTQAELTAQQDAALAELLRPWQEAHPTVEVTRSVPCGSAGHELVAAAADAGLVVVGRRHPAVPVGPRLASATHAVLHHVPAPVAVVPYD